MAQRKPGSAAKSTAKPATKASGGSARSAARSTGAAARKSGGAPAARKSATRPAGGASGGRPPNRKPGKSIVNQKQTPWGLIAATTAVVLFAAAIVIVVIATRKSDSGSNSAGSTTKGGQSVSKNDPYRQAELPAAAAINGVTYRVEGQHTHVDGTIKYDSSPPVGGNHNQYWANCTGTVYGKQIANENAVHMLEHGAIWITYNPNDISGAKLTALKKYVSGIDRMALSPYAGLKTPISMQAWGYQLFLSSPSDPRIAQFIKVLKYNQKTTPEYGASCSDPQFKASESTPGHPFQG